MVVFEDLIKLIIKIPGMDYNRKMLRRCYCSCDPIYLTKSSFRNQLSTVVNRLKTADDAYLKNSMDDVLSIVNMLVEYRRLTRENNDQTMDEVDDNSHDEDCKVNTLTTETSTPRILVTKDNDKSNLESKSSIDANLSEVQLPVTGSNSADDKTHTNADAIGDSSSTSLQSCSKTSQNTTAANDNTDSNTIDPKDSPTTQTISEPPPPAASNNNSADLLKAETAAELAYYDTDSSMEAVQMSISSRSFSEEVNCDSTRDRKLDKNDDVGDATKQCRKESSDCDAIAKISVGEMAQDAQKPDCLSDCGAVTADVDVASSVERSLKRSRSQEELKPRASVEHLAPRASVSLTNAFIDNATKPPSSAASSKRRHHSRSLVGRKSNLSQSTDKNSAPAVKADSSIGIGDDVHVKQEDPKSAEPTLSEVGEKKCVDGQDDNTKKAGNEKLGDNKPESNGADNKEIKDNANNKPAYQSSVINIVDSSDDEIDDLERENSQLSVKFREVDTGSSGKRKSSTSCAGSLVAAKKKRITDTLVSTLTSSATFDPSATPAIASTSTEGTGNSPTGSPCNRRADNKPLSLWRKAISSPSFIPPSPDDSCAIDKDQFQPFTAEIDTSQFDKKTLHRISRLEQHLTLINKAIRECDEKELSLDDMDDDSSIYLQSEGAKRNYVEVWNKLCKLVNRMPTTNRHSEKKHFFNVTEYPQLNRDIERFLNKHKAFPDRRNIATQVKMSLSNQNIDLKESQLRQLIDNVFLTIGNSLQKRRIRDLRIPTTHLVNVNRIKNDPSINNGSLRKKLKANSIISNTNLQSVFDEFASRQRHYEVKGQHVTTSEDESDDPDNLPDVLDDEISNSQELQNTQLYDSELSTQSDSESIIGNEKSFDIEIFSDDSSTLSNITNDSCQSDESEASRVKRLILASASSRDKPQTLDQSNISEVNHSQITDASLDTVVDTSVVAEVGETPSIGSTSTATNLEAPSTPKCPLGGDGNMSPFVSLSRIPSHVLNDSLNNLKESLNLSMESSRLLQTSTSANTKDVIHQDTIIEIPETPMPPIASIPADGIPQISTPLHNSSSTPIVIEESPVLLSATSEIHSIPMTSDTLPISVLESPNFCPTTSQIASVGDAPIASSPSATTAAPSAVAAHPSSSDLPTSRNSPANLEVNPASPLCLSPKPHTYRNQLHANQLPRNNYRHTRIIRNSDRINRSGTSNSVTINSPRLAGGGSLNGVSRGSVRAGRLMNGVGNGVSRGNGGLSSITHGRGYVGCVSRGSGYVGGVSRGGSGYVGGVSRGGGYVGGVSRGGGGSIGRGRDNRVRNINSRYWMKHRTRTSSGGNSRIAAISQPSASPRTASHQNAFPHTASHQAASPRTASHHTALPRTASHINASPRTAFPRTASNPTTSPRIVSHQTAYSRTASHHTAFPRTASPLTASHLSTAHPSISHQTAAQLPITSQGSATCRPAAITPDLPHATPASVSLPYASVHAPISSVSVNSTPQQLHGSMYNSSSALKSSLRVSAVDSPRSEGGGQKSVAPTPTPQQKRQQQQQYHQLRRCVHFDKRGKLQLNDQLDPVDQNAKKYMGIATSNRFNGMFTDQGEVIQMSSIRNGATPSKKSNLPNNKNTNPCVQSSAIDKKPILKNMLINTNKNDIIEIDSD